MIYLGIDDTDTIDTAGTNQLAREIARRLADRLRCLSIVRHQLFFDPRVPYTSKNGSASLRFERLAPISLAEVIEAVRHIMQEWFVAGSDPGFAVAEQIPTAIIAYGQRCKTEIIDQAEPRQLAQQHAIHLEGLGGTEGGVIGALAALGLIAQQSDGRIIHWQSWPEDLTGQVSVDALRRLGIGVRHKETADEVVSGVVDLGKKLRPNLVAGECVLWVMPAMRGVTDHWQAIKCV